ncbi:MAG: PA2779 family protein [Rhodoferax sp.]|nr:PA2779 family protein [Rhodoferax sp.]
MKTFKRLIASLLIVSTTCLGLPMTAQAGIVPTEEAIGASAAIGARERVASFLQREDVASAIKAQGVNGQAAMERVNAMTDAEVTQLAQRIDRAPAGGEILGVLFTVFIILLVTDILGLTKVFPFTRSAR